MTESSSFANIIFGENRVVLLKIKVIRPREQQVPKTVAFEIFRIQLVQWTVEITVY